MSQHHNGQKWYQQKRWIIGSLLLFPPLGIPLLWLTRWPRAGKIGGSIFSGLLLLTVLTGESNEPTTATAPPSTIEAPEALTQAEPALSPAYKDAIASATAATAELTAAESSADWSGVADSWQSAIVSLGDIPINSDDYSQAQVKIAEYERKYDYAISQKEAVEAEAIAQQQAEAERQRAEAQLDGTVTQIVETQGGEYMNGNCKELKTSGVGSNFTPGDANYTSERDRDDDGIACES